MNSCRPLVLVVDDEPDMCWVLQNLLTVGGFDFRVAQTGEAALALLESIRFGIVLLDVKLTDTDGLDLARRIKSMDSSVQIIMISGYYYKDDVNIQIAVEEGYVSGFISKPFLNDDVIEMLRSVEAK
ncbi:MAG: response regulator [Thermodesulfobacteriota bacterium]